MKIWIKYIIGSSIGILVALFMPITNGTQNTVLQFFIDLALRFGQYFLIPVLFFSMCIAVYKLRLSKMLFKTAFHMGMTMLIITFFTTLVGVSLALIVRLPRIPIAVEKVTEAIKLDVPSLFLSLFPFNTIEGLINPHFLLPLFILAGFFGAALATDTIKSKPIISLFDAFSKTTFLITSFITDFFSIFMIAFSCMWMLHFSEILKNGQFNGLLLLLTIYTIFIVTIALPAGLHFLCKEKKPYKILYAGITSAFIAFFSGSINLALGINIRHGKDSLGIKRRLGAVSFPVFSVFLRAGTAPITAMSFIIIFHSYSGLGMSVNDIIRIFVASYILSFLLGHIPVGGSFIALAILCAYYGKGFEAAYLLLKPVSLIIGSFATLIDTMTAFFASYYIAIKQKMIHPKEIKTYI